MESGALQSRPEPVLLVASAEFTLKSSPVRRTLEQRLIDDLKITLSRAGFEGFTIEKHAARIVVRDLHDTESAARSCAKVFGVAYAVPHVTGCTINGRLAAGDRATGAAILAPWSVICRPLPSHNAQHPSKTRD